MSELIDTVKDTFKGGGKKQKLILFGVAAAAVVGVALFVRSRSGSAGSASVPDVAGTGDDSGSGGSADLSGLIDGFGSEIDRIDAAIANLGMTGSGYTTADGSGNVYVPNSANMAAYSPAPEEITVSTMPLTLESLNSGLAAMANNVPQIALPTLKIMQPSAPAPIAVSPMTIAAAPAPASVKLVVAPKPVSAGEESYLRTTLTPPAGPVKTLVKAAPVPVSAGILSRLGGSFTAPVKPVAQPVAAAAPVVKSPVSMPVSPLNPAPTTTIKLATGKTATIPVKKPAAQTVFNNPSRLY